MVRIIQPLLSDAEHEALQQLLDYIHEEEWRDYASLTPQHRGSHIYRHVLTLRSGDIVGRLPLGQLCQTPAAAKAIEYAKQHPWEFTSRHAAGDWGDVCEDDWRSNEEALANGLRVLSSFRTRDDVRIWVITEADRSLTTLLLPEEY